MTKLYEAKFEIKPEQQQELITSLSLQHIKTYSDTDYYLKSLGEQIEKVKELKTSSRHYRLHFDGEVFDIQGEAVSFDQARRLKEKGIEAVIDRTKQVYRWPSQGIECAFDSIRGVKDRLFFEVYERDRSRVLRAVGQLESIGLQNKVTVGYHQLLKGG